MGRSWQDSGFKNKKSLLKQSSQKKCDLNEVEEKNTPRLGGGKKFQIELSRTNSEVEVHAEAFDNVTENMSCSFQSIAEVSKSNI